MMDPKAQHLFEAILEYGRTCDENLIAPLKRHYGEAARFLPVEERSRMLIAIFELVEARRLSANALNPFLLVDPHWHIVSTAALHLVPLWLDSPPDDSLHGTNAVVDLAWQCLRDGEEPRAVAILQGIISLGDRRILQALHGCWRPLSYPGRRQLCELKMSRVDAPLIEWLIEWLEECEGGEYAGVAGRLANLGMRAAEEGVVEVRRSLPLWATPAEPPFDWVQRWTREEYSHVIASRLVSLARAEEGERVMPEVLDCWGLADALDGSREAIQVLADSMEAYRRAMGEMPADAYRQTMAFPPVFVEPDWITAGVPTTLAAWSIFNPYGPTLQLLGRTRRGDTDFLWLAMLNPFRQWYVIFGSLVGDDRWNGEVIAGLLQPFLLAERVTTASNDDLCFVTTPPHMLIVEGDDYLGSDELTEFFGRTPAIDQANLAAVVERLHRTGGDPWERATLELREGEPEREEDSPQVSADELAEWLQAVTSQRQVTVELVGLNEAWVGSIRHHERSGGRLPSLSLESMTALAAQLGFRHCADIAQFLAERGQS
jgi:hypothetical protein